MPGYPKKYVSISKNLSRVLRHRAVGMGLAVAPDGYVKLSDLLAQRSFSGVTREVVEEVGTPTKGTQIAHALWPASVSRPPYYCQIVKSNNKQRFSLVEKGGELYIRANQGHTMSIVKDDALLTEVVDPSEVPVCVHGTNITAWHSIK